MPSSRTAAALNLARTTAVAAAVAAGVATFFPGVTGVETLRFRNQPPAITGTGTTATVVTYSKHAKKAMAATGGLAAYNTLTWSNPETWSGALLSFCLDVGTAASPTTNVDCGIVTDAGTGTGSTIFADESLSRGVHCANVASTTEIVIGPDERIKCASGTGSGQNLSAKAFIEYRQVEL